MFIYVCMYVTKEKYVAESTDIETTKIVLPLR